MSYLIKKKSLAKIDRETSLLFKYLQGSCQWGKTTFSELVSKSYKELHTFVNVVKV